MKKVIVEAAQITRIKKQDTPDNKSDAHGQPQFLCVRPARRRSDAPATGRSRRAPLPN